MTNNPYPDSPDPEDPGGKPPEDPSTSPWAAPGSGSEPPHQPPHGGTPPPSDGAEPPPPSFGAEPPPPPPPGRGGFGGLFNQLGGQRNLLGILSVVTGVLGFCCGPCLGGFSSGGTYFFELPLAIAAVVLGAAPASCQERDGDQQEPGHRRHRDRRGRARSGSLPRDVQRRIVVP